MINLAPLSFVSITSSIFVFCFIVNVITIVFLYITDFCGKGTRRLNNQTLDRLEARSRRWEQLYDVMLSKNRDLERTNNSLELKDTIRELDGERVRDLSTAFNHLLEKTHAAVDNGDIPAETKVTGIRLLLLEYQKLIGKLERTAKKHVEVEVRAGPSVAEKGPGDYSRIPLSELPSTSKGTGAIKEISTHTHESFIASPFEENLFDLNLCIWMTEACDMGALPPGLTLILTTLLKVVKGNPYIVSFCLETGYTLLRRGVGIGNVFSSLTSSVA